MGQQQLDRRLIDNLLYAVLQPLHRNNIWTLDMHPWRVPVRVAIGPTTITLALQLYRPEKDLRAALNQRAAMETYAARALGLGVGRTLPVRVGASGAYFLVEVAHPHPWRPTWGEVAGHAGRSILLGIDQYNQPVSFRLEDYPPGVMVVGKSGSGKTNAMRLITAQALAGGWAVALVDLKGGREWQDDIAVRARWTAWDDAGALDVVSELNSVLDRRNRGDLYHEPPILLVFDEFPESGGRTQEGVARIVRMGRSANMFSLIGAQRAGKREIRPPVIRSTMPTRLVGLVSNAQESADACAMPGLGAEALLGRGDMLLVEDGQRVRRVQVARAEPRDIEHLLRDHVEIVQPKPRQTALALTFDGALRAMEREAGRHPAAKMPPVWLFARTVAYLQRYGRLPSFGLMERWHVEREGTQISQPRRRLVREWARRLVQARMTDEIGCMTGHDNAA